MSASGDDVVSVMKRTVAGARQVVGDQLSDPRDAEGEEIAFPAWVRDVKEWQPPAWPRPPRVDAPHAVQGLIRRGKVGVLVAAGGTGKTTLLLILGVCHATGRPFFGQQVMVGTFVLLSNDDPQEDLEAALDEVIRAMKLTQAEAGQARARVRLHSLQGKNGTKVFTASAGGSVRTTELAELLLEAVRGIDDLVGTALDTLRQFSGGSTNEEEVMKRSIASATDFALTTGSYVVLPHHTGKQNFRDGITDMYCGTGSAAIADNCRFVLLLQTATWPDIESKVHRTGQERGDPLVLVSTRGSLLMQPLPPIFLHRDGFYIGRVAGATLSRDQQEDKKDRDILNAVAAGADSKNAVYRAVGGKKTSTLDRVDELVARGHIGSRSGSKKLILMSSGSKFIEATK